MRIGLVVVLLMWSATSAAALVVDNEHFIYIAGPIEKGDYERFSEIVRKNTSPLVISLMSSGGDVDVAMKIGRLIRAKGFATSVPDDAQCASACVLLLAAGVQRIIYERARITIHRPYLEGGLENDEAYDINYKRMVDALNKYFMEMNVPGELVGRMMTIPPHRGEDLMPDELTRYMLSGADPAYEQKQSSKESRKLGVSVSEMNKRKAISEQLCAVAYQHSAQSELTFLDFVAFHYCEEAIVTGQSPDIVEKRLRFVLGRREQIELLNNSAQESCVQAIVLSDESKNCALRW